MTLSVEDLPESWGRVKEECEDLIKHNTALGGEFENRLKNILSNIESTLAELEGGDYGDIQTSLRSFAIMVRNDIENVRSATRLVKRLKEAEEEFQRLRSRLKEYETRAYEACGMYFERRQEYVRALEKAEERSRRMVREIKKDFIERAKDVVRGYELLYSGMPCTPEELFQELVKGVRGTVELRPLKKGLLGGSNEEEVLAKREVMDYLINETREKLVPVLKIREESLRDLEAMFPDLQGLERACRRAEELREKAMEPLEKLRKEIVEIRRKGVQFYSAKEKVEEILGRYLKNIEEVEKSLT